MHPGAGHKSIADLHEAHQQFIAKSGDRCHVLAAVLRHPVERVLAEYSVGIRRVTGTSAAGLETYDCNHSDCTDTDLTNRMGQGAISLAQYITYNHRSRTFSPSLMNSAYLPHWLTRIPNFCSACLVWLAQVPPTTASRTCCRA